MAKVTSKLQVTIPKRIADVYGIRPGDDVDWVEAGDARSASFPRAARRVPTPRRRLALFEAATARQQARQAGRDPLPAGGGRGWHREELYVRGRAG